MTCIRDPKGILKRELARLYDDFKLPGDFPPGVLKNANDAASRHPNAQSHKDRTTLPFATLDPASSTDLDQAFHIERSGADIVLHYAIADVPWFVDYDSPMAQEAWRRGETIYLPGDRMSLYPEIISQGVASLLPDGPRPAVMFTIRVDPDGISRLDGVERSLIRSRAKLAYETATETDLPDGFAELALRVEAAERERGAARIDTPEQELEETEDGRLRLSFRKRHRAEGQNAALSLAANLAVAQFLLEHRTGLFRVMDEPDAKAVARLRVQAAALDVNWPANEPLKAMAHAGSLAERTDAAVLDLAEAVMLRGREGELFNALVIDADDKGRVTARLAKLPVVVRVYGNDGELQDAKFGIRRRREASARHDRSARSQGAVQSRSGPHGDESVASSQSVARHPLISSTSKSVRSVTRIATSPPFTPA